MPWGVLEYTIGANKYIPIVPNPKQFQFLALECEDAMYGGSAGGGKLLITCTLIPTPDGLKKLSDVEPGSKVFGIDGSPATVVAQSEVIFDRAWELTFDDGSTVVAHDDHLWLTYDAKELGQLTRLDARWRAKRRAKRPSRSAVGAGTKINHTPEHRARLSKAISERNARNAKPKVDPPKGTVRTTAQIVATLKLESGRANHAIPVCGDVQHAEKELPLDPYILGLWLGDGSRDAGVITTMDPEVVQAVVDAGFPNTSRQDKEDSKASSYYFSGLRTKLVEIGVFGNKHIPQKYMTGSVAQREALLAGLLDSDGHCNKEGQIEFCVTRHCLATGMAELACSLGHKATLREGKAKIGEKDYGPKWTVKFTANRPLFRLPRHASKQKIQQRRTTKFRYIVDAKRTEVVPMKCIQVDRPDGMFLCTENYIPTHNSAALLMAALQFVSVPHYSAMILRRSYADLKQPGALIDMSREWLSKSDANYNSQDHRWRFPSGASLQFGYAESDSDIYRYKGSEFQFVGIDEASEMTEIQLRYLFSRMRRRNDIPVPMRYRLATNPGGKSHEFIKDRYIKNPGERVFIKATLDDNDAIDKDQYRAMLDNLDPVNRAQLLMGDWDVAASGRFKREDLEKSKYEIVDEGFGQGGAYLLGSRRVMVADCWKMITVDPASTSKDTSDYTVVSTFAVTPCRQLIWLDMLRFRKEIPEIVQEVQSAYWQWQPAFVAIEAVASNRAVLQIAQRTSMTVREVSPRGLDKLVRATPAMQLASEGRLWMPKKAHWLEAAVQELLVFSGNPTKDAHDDVVDALSYASALMGEFDDSNEGFKPMLLFGRKW